MVNKEELIKFVKDKVLKDKKNEILKKISSIETEYSPGYLSLSALSEEDLNTLLRSVDDEIKVIESEKKQNFFYSRLLNVFGKTLSIGIPLISLAFIIAFIALGTFTVGMMPLWLPTVTVISAITLTIFCWCASAGHSFARHTNSANQCTAAFLEPLKAEIEREIITKKLNFKIVTPVAETTVNQDQNSSTYFSELNGNNLPKQAAENSVTLMGRK